MFVEDAASLLVTCFCAVIAVIFAIFLIKLLRDGRMETSCRRAISLKNKEIGDNGEFRLWVILETRLNKMAFKILHDIHLPIDGKTTQIDFIVVSCWGIFVIEAKTWNASIYGEATDPEWIAYYDRAKPFPSPLLQNQWHIQALSSCLDLDSEQYMESIVAFAAETVFRMTPPENVMHFQDVPDYILSHLGDFCFHANDLPQIVDAILDCDPTISPENRDEHTTNIPLARLRRYCPPPHARTYS